MADKNSEIMGATIIGELDISTLSRNADNISVSGAKFSKVFYDPKPDMIIHPGADAFFVRVHNLRGKVVSTFTAIVTAVKQFEINPSKDTVKLTFRYMTPSPAANPVMGNGERDLPVFGPLLTHIYHSNVEGDHFCTLILEGDEESLSAFASIDRMATFQHGNREYHRTKSFFLNSIIDERAVLNPLNRNHLPVPFGIIIIGTEKAVPSNKRMDAYLERLNNFLMRTYNFDLRPGMTENNGE